MMAKITEKLCSELLKAYRKAMKAMLYNPVKDEYTLVLDDMGQAIDRRKIENGLAKVREKANCPCHVKTFEMASYFKELTSNNMELLNELNYSVILYDPDGFITPMKSMANRGHVLGMQDSVHRLFESAKERFNAVEGYKRQMLHNTYMAVVDASSAALLARNYSVPVPDEIPKALRQYFVDNKTLEKVYASLCEDVIRKYRAFEHGSLNNISGKELAELHNAATAFVERMKTFVKAGF